MELVEVDIEQANVIYGDIPRIVRLMHFQKKMALPFIPTLSGKIDRSIIPKCINIEYCLNAMNDIIWVPPQLSFNRGVG